jgi:hypothetical protein
MSTADPVRTRPVFTVTRTSPLGGHIQSSRYTLTASTRPGEACGPYSPGELKVQLLVRALLDPATIRDTIQAAWCAGTARIEGAIVHTTEPMED